MRSLVMLALVSPSLALILGTGASRTISQPRAMAPRCIFDMFKGGSESGAKTVDARKCPPSFATQIISLSEEEVDALYSVSMSAVKPAEGKEGASKDILGEWWEEPLKFALMLRDPRKDPPAGVWDAVREFCPVLTERSNEELTEAMAVLKQEPVDLRQI